MNSKPKKKGFLSFLGLVGESADFVNTDHLTLANLLKPPIKDISKYSTQWDYRDFE